MKNLATRPWFFLSILLLALAVGGTINTDRAQAHGVHCNTAVNGVTMKLLHDIGPAGGCDSGTFGVKIMNGGHLNLNGFTITCGPSIQRCIWIEGGRKNSIHDGTIDGGIVAIYLKEADQNQIHDVTISGTSNVFDYGIRAFSSSSKNRITDVTINLGRSMGIRLENGSRNNQIHGSTLRGANDGASDANTNCDRNNWKDNTILQGGATPPCAGG